MGVDVLEEVNDLMADREIELVDPAFERSTNSVLDGMLPLRVSAFAMDCSAMSMPSALRNGLIA